MTRHASLRRSSRLRHSRCCNMSPRLDVFHCLLATYLAALRLTISILLMPDLRWGSHTEQAYSSDGLTNDFICLFFNGGITDVQTAMQEAKSLIGFTTDVVDVAFPFEVLTDANSQIFCFINRFEDMTMKAIIKFHRCFIMRDGEHVAFIWVESHLP